MVCSGILCPSDSVVFIQPAPSTPTRRSVALAYSEGAGWDSPESFAATHGPKVVTTQSYQSRKMIVNKRRELVNTEATELPGQAITLPPQGAPQRIRCPRRPHCPNGIGLSLARDLCRPTQEPCTSCRSLETCQIKNN